MLTEKEKIYKTCSKWCPFIRTKAWSRFLHSSMAPSMTVCVWPYINQALFQLVDVACALLLNTVSKTTPKFCNRLNLGQAIRWPDVGRNEIRCDLVQILDGGTYTMGRCAELAQALVCESAPVAMATVAAVAVWIIFTINNPVLLQEQFDQMVLILVDVCESYWP